jgi:DNA repair protein RadC
MKTSFELHEIVLKYIRKPIKTEIDSKGESGAMYCIQDSRHVYEILLEIWDLDSIDLHESFLVLFLNRGNYFLGYRKISEGGYDGTIVDIRSLMATALLCACSGMVLAHNHPSGNLKPSDSDVRLTNEIIQVAGLHKIKVFDHIIITREGYLSFVDEDLISVG